MGSAEGQRAGSELLVCFPSRMVSPGRSADATRRVRSSSSRGHSSPGPGPMFSMRGRGQGRAKNNSEEIEEPRSPKVTCAGQVRVKPTKDCKSWQSVMAEIEKLHQNKHRKRGGSGPMASPGRAHQQPKRGHVMGLKKEVVQFVTALRNLRVDFGCFGPPAAVASDEEEEEDRREAASSGTVFAKWFMILQDNDEKRDKVESGNSQQENCGPPPPNALVLMRCRSAPSLRSSFTRVEDSERERKGKDTEDLLRRYEADLSGVGAKDFVNQSFMRSVSLKR